MLKIAFHPYYVHPLPERHRFPMEKYALLHDQLLYEGVVETESFFEPVLVDPIILEEGHCKNYVRDLLTLQLDPKMVRRIGFPLSQALVDRERYLIDGTIQCCNYAREYGVAFNIAGGTHHAGYDYGEGFCLMNDQAVAAVHLLKKGSAKNILIIDLDVHQGNGTAHIMSGKEGVFTLSIHGKNNYPFQKEVSTLDVELEDNVMDQEYLTILHETLTKVFKIFEPDFIFYQAGVDVLKTDKLGKLALSRDGCQQRDEIVFNFCVRKQVPVQVSMGGGYSSNIRDIVDAHVNTYKTAIKIYNI